MPEIDFEFVELFLKKLDFSCNQKKIVYDKIHERINENGNKISLNELDLVAGGSMDLDSLPKKSNGLGDKN